MRKIVLLMLVLSVVLSAKIWVNAIRDPGAELGTGDWTTEIWENKAGASDSAKVSIHDSTRSYDGKFSFLTDTYKRCYVEDGITQLYCKQTLPTPKAVADVDSCFWVFNMAQGDKDSIANFFICFHTSSYKNIIWVVGSASGTYPDEDTNYAIQLTIPEKGTWTEQRDNLKQKWLDHDWSSEDSIIQVELSTTGGLNGSRWFGQEVSWDNIVLRSVAYYDYASKSIDSDELTGPSYTPIVTFANEGIKADKDAYVYAEILSGSTSVYVDSLKVSIPKESTKQVTFKPWSVTGGGPFTLRAYPKLELDELSTDDTLAKSLGGIQETGSQIEPLRITQTSTDVEFSFTTGTRGELSIFDACGREVFRSAINPNTGDLHWSTRGMPSGLYFSRFTTSDKTLTNKLLVIK
ncbi:T9SS type A sorting domain-containing protein [bacterium]|nr:T9SS type A sorting domain-containing protein [bacterium]